MKYILNIEEIEKYYTITEDGQVFNKSANRWMKPHLNNYGYVYICITQGVDHVRHISAHTLVIYKFIGTPPSIHYEVDHIDQNRGNNHYTNLQWITHSANIKKAYDNGREHYWRGKSRPSPNVITRIKMADAKNKKILYKSITQEIVFSSIEEAASRLSTYRKKIYNSIRDGKPVQGGVLSYYQDASNTRTIIDSLQIV
jgi:hypothetical protein